MAQTTLRVRAKGTAKVQNYEAMEAGAPKRFIGWNALANGFESTTDVVEVPNRKEYRDEVSEGALEAADLETAKACGVPFVAMDKAVATAKSNA